MPVTSWNVTTINGAQWLVVDLAQFRVPMDWDPNSNMVLAIAMPDTGFATFPILAKGDPGDSPTIDTAINFTALDPTDPTDDSASFTLIGTDEYQLNLTLHKGPKGDPGTSILDPTAYGTPTPGQILIVNPTSDGFVYQAQKVGDRYIPAVINAMPAGNPAYTLAPVSVPPQPNDWRPKCTGQTVFSPTAGDTAYDLLARAVFSSGQTESSGPIVARGVGVAGLAPPIPATGLQAGPPAGSSDTYDKIPAGMPATIYLRAERQAGSGTATTDVDTTTFAVWVNPVP